MRRLKEILEDEQEPFDLEAYLLERGCSTNSKTTLSTEEAAAATTNALCQRTVSSVRNLITVASGSGHHLHNDGIREEPWRLSETMTSNQDASASSTNGIQTHQSKKTATPNPKIFLPDNATTTSTSSALCQKNVSSVRSFVTVALGRGHHLSNGGVTEEPERLSETMKSNQDASASSMYNTQTQTHQPHQSNKSSTDSKIEWTVKDENKQSSPDSVLDETPIREGRQGGGSKRFKKPTEDSILSASLWELTIRTEKPGISSSSYISSKKTLQETRQLLFDCVREAVESQTGHLMEPESLGKLICDNTIGQSARGNKNTRLRKSDLLAIFKEWDNLEKHTQDVIQQVGDQILEQIKDEIVEEVIGFYTKNVRACK